MKPFLGCERAYVKSAPQRSSLGSPLALISAAVLIALHRASLDIRSMAAEIILHRLFAARLFKLT